MTDPREAEALHELEPWRAAGDSVDWDLAVLASIVTAGTTIAGVHVPAGHDTRSITGGGYHITTRAWPDRDALTRRLDAVDDRHHRAVHIAHADARTVTAHTAVIDACARGVPKLIGRDARDGGPLDAVPVRCWHDLDGHVDGYRYLDEVLPAGPHDEVVTAVIDRADTLLHERDHQPQC
ncbi:hypothetical protein [Dactylosporangium matsuzakiense]|uniref:Uncharacterized protein n=1 Tax=Dactylosporangium matsuzakiense TaxID=53360 RepID=A0A9W6NNT2_9ACTN|nr:hypothetical protein [Dactylosporangium matsuzakiense]GLL03734.1 hypothetical protein GCM10017581_054800 [Dactylosporangium matsuzakiense]